MGRQPRRQHGLRGDVAAALRLDRVRRSRAARAAPTATCHNAGLDEIARYADIVAPWKPYIVPSAGTDANGDGDADDVNGDGDGRRARPRGRGPTSLIRRAHKRGLDVHTWTFRNEARRLAADYGGDPKAASTSCSTPSASTACSPISRTRRVAAREEFFEG